MKVKLILVIFFKKNKIIFFLDKIKPDYIIKNNGKNLNNYYEEIENIYQKISLLN